MYKHRLITDTDPENFDSRLKEELSTIPDNKIINVQFSTSYCPDKENPDGMQTVYSALIIYKG